METDPLQERSIEMLTKIKMLLVDGDDGIRRSLSLFFGYRHCHLHTAENAIQALIAIEKEPYDIIICEELLPDMNGLNFFEILLNSFNVIFLMRFFIFLFICCYTDILIYHTATAVFPH